MKGGVLIICGGEGVSDSMLALLREHQSVVMVADRFEPVVLDALVLDVAPVRELPQHMRPLPIPAALAANLPKRSSWHVPARSLPRPREQRTRRAK